MQSSVLCRSNNKLTFRYFGPYSIIRCINPVAYEVELPSKSKIHPIFHVSQLRKVLKPGTPTSTTLPVSTDVIPVPVKIVASRWHRTPTGRREQIQVQWSPDSDLDVSWEDKLELQHRFRDKPTLKELMIKARTKTWASLIVTLGPRGSFSPTTTTLVQTGRSDLETAHRFDRLQKLHQPLPGDHPWDHGWNGGDRACSM